MERVIKITEDNSKTLFIEELNECYHSHHGALQESRHVFIKNGLALLDKPEINILELGFGTGLNVLVTLEKFLSFGRNVIIRYYTLEKYPISFEEIEQLEHAFLFNNDIFFELNSKIHSCEWEKQTEIVSGFELKKIKVDFFDLEREVFPPVDLVYFDCFGARVQPYLWENRLFDMVFKKMAVGSLLTTYSSKGSVRRILEKLGMKVEKKEGPKGKREMINAWKIRY